MSWFASAGWNLILTPDSLRRLDFDYGQRKPQLQLIIEINLDMVEAELLELYPAEIMHIGCVPFHLLQIEMHLRLRNRLGVIRSHNFRALMKAPGAAAPARPDAESKIIYRQLGRRHDVEHAHQGLHPVKLAAHILAQDAALEIGQDDLSLHGGNLLERRNAESKKP